MNEEKKSMGWGTAFAYAIPIYLIIRYIIVPIIVAIGGSL
jgi:signal peptidase I